MAKNRQAPPYTNRGAQNTSDSENVGLNSSQNALILVQDLAQKNHRKCDFIIDWFEFTIKSRSLHQILKELHIDLIDLKGFDTGFYGYDMTYVYKEKIKFLISHDDMMKSEKEKMGVHVIMSGYACREFEKHIIPDVYNNWIYLIDYLDGVNANISRIDLAFDSYSDYYFTPNRCIRKLKRGEITCNARYGISTKKYSITDGEIHGESLKLGSSLSQVMVMIYDKKEERMSANYIVDDSIEHWYRLELRLRRDAAKNYVKAVASGNNPLHIAIMQLNDYVDFKDNKERQTDTNKSRWKSAAWWSDFINVAYELSLSSKAIQTSIQRKKNWLELSVSKALAQVLLRDHDTININEVAEFLSEGMKKIKGKDIDVINTYRLEQGGSIITQEQIDDLISRLNFK